MSYKIIGKKDATKGFSVDSLIEIANGIKIKIKDLIGLKNGEHKIEQDIHDIDENTEFELANGTKYKLSDLVNQEIDLGNGKKEKLIDLVKSGKIKLSAEKTDEGEKADEKKDEENDEGKKAIKNCTCGMKNSKKHMKNCSMYNEKEGEPEDTDQEKELKAKNAKVEALENEIKALKEGITNGNVFVRVNNAKNNANSDEAVLLANSRSDSGSMEEGLARGRDYFGSKN